MIIIFQSLVEFINIFAYAIRSESNQNYKILEINNVNGKVKNGNIVKNGKKSNKCKNDIKESKNKNTKMK